MNRHNAEPSAAHAASGTSATARAPAQTGSRSYLVPVLSKALHIVRLLEQERGPVSCNELARRTGYSLTTVYRILRTLEAHSFLPDACAGAYTFHRAYERRRQPAHAARVNAQPSGAAIR